MGLSNRTIVLLTQTIEIDTPSFYFFSDDDYEKCSLSFDSIEEQKGRVGEETTDTTNGTNK